MSDSTGDDGDYVQVEGIGGIHSAAVELSPGLTVLAGANATNRTSLIHALNAVLGGSRGVPNVEASEGRVEMRLGGTEYHRTVREAGDGGAVYSGEPATDEPGIVDTYVTLDARNPIRQSVMQGDVDGANLRDLLMLPVDDAEIRREIRGVREKRDEVEQELNRIDRLKERLPDLEARKQELGAELADVETELSETRDEIEEAQVDVDAAAEARELFTELEAAEQEYDRLNERLSDASETLQTAREERDELEDRVDELEAEVDENAMDADRLDDLREERNRLDGVVELVQQARHAVREISGSDRIPDELAETGGDTVGALSGGEVSCWACGSAVSEEAFDEQAEALDSLVAEYRGRLRDVESDMEEMHERERDMERMRESLEGARTRLRERERTVETYEDRVERLEKELTEQTERVENLREQVEETESLRDHRIVDLHEEARDLSREQGSLERELNDVESELEDIEQAVDKEKHLREQSEELSDRIKSLNARVKSLEEDVVERLQAHLDALVELLEYEAVERIRVDHKTSDESANEVSLSVVRSGEGGAIEDSHGLTALSESERSLVGLAVAVAAYQTHDVAKEVPMILLDSIEEFDGGRIQRLIEYITNEVPRVIVALLPEDAAKVTTEYGGVQAEEIA